MNKIILTGNLTRDFEYNSNSSISWAKSAIAVNRPFSKNNEVDFFNIVAFGKTADFCKKYLGKGRRVFVEGRLQTSEYTGKDGVKRMGFEVMVDNIEFGDNKGKPANTSDNSSSNSNYDVDDVDVPF